MSSLKSRKRALAAQAAAEAMAAGAKVSQIKVALSAPTMPADEILTVGERAARRAHSGKTPLCGDGGTLEMHLAQLSIGTSGSKCISLPIEVVVAILDAGAPDCSALNRQGTSLLERREALARALQHRHWLKNVRLASKDFDLAVKLLSFWRGIAPHATTEDDEGLQVDPMRNAESRLKKACILCWRNGVLCEDHQTAVLLATNLVPSRTLLLPLHGPVTVHDLLYDPSIGDMGRNSILTEQARAHSMCSVCFVSDGDSSQNEDPHETAYGYSGRMYIYNTFVSAVDPISIYPSSNDLTKASILLEDAVRQISPLDKKPKGKRLTSLSTGGTASGSCSPAPALDTLRPMPSNSVDLQITAPPSKSGKYPLCHRCRTRLLDGALHQSPIFLIFTSMFDLWRAEVTRRTRALHGQSSFNSLATSSAVSREASTIATPEALESGASTPASALMPLSRDSVMLEKNTSKDGSRSERSMYPDVDLSTLIRSGTAEIDTRLTKLAQGSAWTKMYWLREDWVANAHAPRAKFGSGGDGQRSEGVGSVVHACEQAMMVYIDLQ